MKFDYEKILNILFIIQIILCLVLIIGWIAWAYCKVNGY